MLSSASFRTIIHRWVPLRSPFDKTNYIENFIPKDKQLWKRQEKWDDPNYNWPPKMPKYTKLEGKGLVQALENEYLQEIKKTKKYDEIRTGDLIEVQNYYSLSGKQHSSFVGVCTSRRRRNSLSNSLNVIGIASHTQLEQFIPLYSPLVKDVRMVERGSGNYRARLNYFRDFELTKYTALIRGSEKNKKPTHIAKQEEKEMRYKLLTGKFFDDDGVNIKQKLEEMEFKQKERQKQEEERRLYLEEQKRREIEMRRAGGGDGGGKEKGKGKDASKKK
ncbi:unnamed protein product [Blepharisma stoltei]|uniref:50S ribosomal protein L19, chloroplastic n=1 Tax=Blepharisma stoltei TaxID=1481888 RepID=A0AAU9KCT8_9CILI|nr:unnamed protein product [Blepharisma stoltei]